MVLLVWSPILAHTIVKNLGIEKTSSSWVNKEFHWYSSTLQVLFQTRYKQMLMSVVALQISLIGWVVWRVK